MGGKAVHISPLGLADLVQDGLDHADLGGFKFKFNIMPVTEANKAWDLTGLSSLAPLLRSSSGPRASKNSWMYKSSADRSTDCEDVERRQYASVKRREEYVRWTQS